MRRQFVTKHDGNLALVKFEAEPYIPVSFLSGEEAPLEVLGAFMKARAEKKFAHETRRICYDGLNAAEEAAMEIFNQWIFSEETTAEGILLKLAMRGTYLIFEKSYGYRKARLGFLNLEPHRVLRDSIFGEILRAAMPEDVEKENHNVVRMCVVFEGIQIFFYAFSADHFIFIGDEKDLFLGEY